MRACVRVCMCARVPVCTECEPGCAGVNVCAHLSCCVGSGSAAAPVAARPSLLPSQWLRRCRGRLLVHPPGRGGAGDLVCRPLRRKDRRARRRVGIGSEWKGGGASSERERERQKRRRNKDGKRGEERRQGRGCGELEGGWPRRIRVRPRGSTTSERSRRRPSRPGLHPGGFQKSCAGKERGSSGTWASMRGTPASSVRRDQPLAESQQPSRPRQPTLPCLHPRTCAIAVASSCGEAASLPTSSPAAAVGVARCRRRRRPLPPGGDGLGASPPPIPRL